MVRPIDIQDQLTKTPIIEKVQQADKVAEESQQKYSHLNLEQTSQKQVKLTQPTNEDEKIGDSYEKKDKSKKQEKGRDQKEAEGLEPDPDEKQMTHLGYEIDLFA